MSTLRVDNITNAAGSAGPTFNGNSIIAGSLQVNGTLLDSGGQDILANIGNADRLENGSTQIILSANDLSPDSNNTRDLGKSGTRYRDLYIGRKAYLNLTTSEIHESTGSYGIGGNGNLRIYDPGNPPQGSYLVYASFQSRGGAPNGDPDPCSVRLAVGGSEVCRAKLYIQDSSQTNYEDYGAFTAAYYVDGSTSVYVDLFTDDTDPGGADVNYQVNVFRLGG